ncbi:uncharacterized protein G2W53_022064 [Senna tora]|uniref:Secreted protein n=1 Tax=Senna tora TaxID=362788 RepID=A0A834TLA9_9FABA|nr:uncharacterized protein G2W53_022064 [Senna tora]
MVFAQKHLLSLLIKFKIIAASARRTMVLLLTPSGFTSVSIADLGYLHSRTSSCTGPALLIEIFAEPEPEPWLVQPWPNELSHIL